MSFVRILSLWTPVLAFMGLLFYLSSRSDLLLHTPNGWDKLLHAGAYALLAGLSIRAFHGGLGRLAPWPTFFALLLTVAYGMLDEMHQSRVVGRDASLLDWAADVIGAALAVVLVGMFALLRSRRSVGDPHARLMGVDRKES